MVYFKNKLKLTKSEISFLYDISTEMTPDEEILLVEVDEWKDQETNEIHEAGIYGQFVELAEEGCFPLRYSGIKLNLSGQSK